VTDIAGKDHTEGAPAEPAAPIEPFDPQKTSAPFPAPDRRLTIGLLFALILFMAITGGWPLLLVVGSIIVMIVLHELGHYIAAKKSGMKVTEFFVGFGPKLWSYQRGETEYGVKAFPVGAYVRIIGMNNLEEVPPEDEPRTYRQQSYPKRFAVAVAGSTMHFLQALVAVFLVFTIFGAPGGHLFTHHDDFVVGDVEPNSAALAAGIQTGDRVVSIDGTSITSFDQLHDVVSARPGKAVPIVLERNGNQIDTETTIGTQDGHGFLGIGRDIPGNERVNPITAAGRTVTEVGTISKESLGFFGAFFSPSGLSHFADTVLHPSSPTVSNDTSGSTAGSSTSSSSTVDENRPVSIIGAARFGTEIVHDGPFAFLAFFASINIVIGMFNLIPLLPLDGGHLAIATYERIRSRKGHPYRADVMKLMPLTYAVVLILVLLAAGTIFLDLVNPITLN
jgi:membrane-associated protease RseP (regulator of RpoE activity)